jgi:hypothetical protein
MLFKIRPYRRFPEQCAVTYNAGTFVKLPLAYLLGFGLLIIILVLSRGPVYAEWVGVGRTDKINVFVDPDTIRHKGDQTKMWHLFDFKTVQTLAGIPHLSLMQQYEYDCAEDFIRELAVRVFSGNMGGGDLVYSSSDEGKWRPAPSGSIAMTLRKGVCNGRDRANNAARVKVRHLF